MRILNNPEEWKIRKLDDGTFPFPDFSDPTYLIKLGVEKDSDLIAAGILKVTTETILYLSSDISKFEKAKACKLLFSQLSSELIKSGLNDNHLFVLKDQDRFSSLLTKHFGFQEATGKPLYWKG